MQLLKDGEVFKNVCKNLQNRQLKISDRDGHGLPDKGMKW